MRNVFKPTKIFSLANKKGLAVVLSFLMLTLFKKQDNIRVTLEQGLSEFKKSGISCTQYTIQKQAVD